MNEERITHSPQRWGPISRALSRWILKLWGWRIDSFPALDKVVAVGGPHTSNWDGVLGFLSAIALNLDTAFLIKASAFKWPLASILRRSGGIPIDRTRATGVVEQAADLFKHRERLVMVVTPEGTRTNAPHWKTGFHHIARLAGVPIVVAVPNYTTKELHFPLILNPGEDMEADMQKIINCFADTTPKHLEKLSAPVKAARKARVERG
ncbi:MAG TPA: 1-acyl-sn-glycerol-3-phosphate acyltransferase [Gammaproteobacteria bacterium]|nr:1-acyl-sn-glycerol-3-phosphate acyltransferase [Gammaproteobacteria bacterium]